MDYICSGNLDFSGGGYIIKSHGGKNFLIRNNKLNSSYHWTTATRPTIVLYSGAIGYGATGMNFTTGKLECFVPTTGWVDLF